LLRQLRAQYQAVRESTDDHGYVESFQAIDARLREAFRWLEKAITYLNGLKPPIEHRFDLGYGYVFDSPRFAHGSVGQHERRIRGFPVLEGIDVYYEVSAAKPLSIEVVAGWVSLPRRPSMHSGCSTPTPRGRFRRDAAQMHLFSPARDPGAGLVSCRLSDGHRDRDTRQRRSPRARHAGVPEHRDRGAHSSRISCG
jgi:hypothetical protein